MKDESKGIAEQLEKKKPLLKNSDKAIVVDVVASFASLPVTSSILICSFIYCQDIATD